MCRSVAGQRGKRRFDVSQSVIQIGSNDVSSTTQAGGLARSSAIPIRIHLSFLLLLGFVLLSMNGLIGLAVVVMVAGSVVLHELGHALVARHLGVPVAAIGLHFFGGAAELKGLARRPGDEIAIAVAGPAVSFALAGVGHALAPSPAWTRSALFGFVNLVLARSTCYPRSRPTAAASCAPVLARKHGLVRATDVAVKVGRSSVWRLRHAGSSPGTRSRWCWSPRAVVDRRHGAAAARMRVTTASGAARTPRASNTCPLARRPGQRPRRRPAYATPRRLRLAPLARSAPKARYATTSG